MKALTFLEYWEIWFYKPRKIEAYYDIINKPFTPDMIVQYFEVAQKDNDYNNSKGWIRDKVIYPETDSCYNWRVNLVELKQPVNSIYVCGFDSYWYFGIDGTFSGFDRFIRHELTKPKTINDFISDCTRSGIELTFKQEIADKLK